MYHRGSLFCSLAHWLFKSERVSATLGASAATRVVVLLVLSRLPHVDAIVLAHLPDPWFWGLHR
jgi:hypothetical protein